jgi:anti-sigma factor RsiW
LNPIPEFDLELLEAYLDDALSPGQVQHVAQRLLAEPELAAAMHDLRAERALRTAVWRNAEPSDDEASRLAKRIRSSICRIELRQRALRIVRIGSAVAAAILVFGGGWFLGHSGSDPSAGEVPTVPAVFPHSNRLIRETQVGGRFEVPLMDQTGKVIAVQRFSSEIEARQFSDDLVKYEVRRRQVQGGGAVLVSDHF